ncbi:hypothetical protein BpHYR1_049281 [Brachionus plicatilis]|uniref:Uncharacterized protein n=1 Tax=Brachionus plicatilis TaxID=10195 RepID=A0A3M7S095_BRAPC|nr:hypothetical protein BpHYR1_049281 [Brachionus plicatilis]
MVEGLIKWLDVCWQVSWHEIVGGCVFEWLKSIICHFIEIGWYSVGRANVCAVWDVRFLFLSGFKEMIILFILTAKHRKKSHFDSLVLLKISKKNEKKLFLKVELFSCFLEEHRIRGDLIQMYKIVHMVENIDLGNDI